MLNAKEITDDQAIKLAVKELHKINANPETRAHLEACDRYVRDMALTRGYAYKKGKKEIIQKMLANGKSKEEIISFIGISEEEYEIILNA